jgi:hypothetical protein
LNAALALINAIINAVQLIVLPIELLAHRHTDLAQIALKDDRLFSVSCL